MTERQLRVNTGNLTTERWKLRLRHWAVLLGLVAIVLAALNQLFVASPLIAKARQIHLGQSEQEVRSVLGQPNMWQSHPGTFTTSRSWYGPVQAWWDWNVAYSINSRLPKWLPVVVHEFSGSEYPVEIQFDAARRVKLIRIGRTVSSK